VISTLSDAPFDRIECADVALADRERARRELLTPKRRRRA
jgi:hypothetical protein